MNLKKLRQEANLKIESWHLDGEREWLESRRDTARNLLDYRRAAQEVDKVIAGLIQTCIHTRAIRRLIEWPRTIFFMLLWQAMDGLRLGGPEYDVKPELLRTLAQKIGFAEAHRLIAAEEEQQKWLDEVCADVAIPEPGVDYEPTYNDEEGNEGGDP